MTLFKQGWRASARQKQQHLESQSLWRERRTVASAQQPFVQVENEWLTNFSSNDYLGLAAHPLLADAVSSASMQWGVGSGASHMVCGHQNIHHQFEEELAEFVGAERALLFSTGYMANLAIGSAILEKGDLSLQDRLNHASLLDGARLSGATLKRFAHRDVDHAKRKILASDHRRLQLVSDGVFSMDGDIAPISELKKLSDRHDALLCIDDAHGFGVLGAGGRGTLSSFGLTPTENTVMVGTLGKAFGSFGAFIAGDDWLVEQLLQSARSYIYTTALPPTVVAAGRAALELMRESHTSLSNTLMANISQFKKLCADRGVKLMNSESPIQPVLIGLEHEAVAVSDALNEQGFLVPAIRTPTVAKGQARLRVTLTAAHTEFQVSALVDAMCKALAGVENCEQCA